ncbi:MAG: hypothetical protein ACRELG_16150 [Gemmataceae bacterium]
MSETVRRWKRYPAYKRVDLDWLESVSDHWTDKTLKRSCGLNREGLSEETPGDYEIAYVDIGNVDSLGNSGARSPDAPIPSSLGGDPGSWRIEITPSQLGFRLFHASRK